MLFPVAPDQLLADENTTHGQLRAALWVLVETAVQDRQLVALFDVDSKCQIINNLGYAFVFIFPTAKICGTTAVPSKANPIALGSLWTAGAQLIRVGAT